MDNPILSVKANDDDLNIEIDILPNKDKVLEQQLTDLKSEISFLDTKINKYKAHTDSIDYLVSVSCGFLAGIVDALIVDGGFNNISYDSDPKELLKEGINTNINNNDSLVNGITNAVFDWNFKLLNILSLNPNKSITGIPSNISSSLSSLLNEKPFSSKDSLNDFRKITNEALKENNNFLGISNFNDKITKLGKECIPVLLNEALIRFYYFIRRLSKVIKDNKIKKINDLNKDLLKEAIPFDNRTIVRMISISTSVMTAIDLGCAALKSINSNNFGMNFILNINFIGIGRTVVAISTDAVMGAKLHNSRNRRMKLMNEYNALLNKKIFYKQGDMWVNAMNTDSAINSSFNSFLKAQNTIKEAISSNKDDLKKIGDNSNKIDVNNPGLKDDIKDIIEWE